MKNIILIAIVVTGLTSCTINQVDQIDIRDEYAGDYQVSDACDAPGATYTLSVYKDQYTNDEIIFGFPGLYQANLDVHAIVTGYKIVIPIQRYYISTTPEIFYEFSGSGSLQGNMLTVYYEVVTVQDGYLIDDVNCTATMLQ